MVGNRRIFISHCDADRDFALRLAEDLCDRLDLDVRHVVRQGEASGHSRSRSRHDAASDTKQYPILIVVLSPDAVADWDKQDKAYRADSASHLPPGEHTFVILCRPCAIPTELASFPFVSFAPPASYMEMLPQSVLPILWLQCHGESASTLRRRGKRLLKRKHYEEAALVLEFAVRRDPTDWRAWSWLGRTLSVTKRHEEAVAAFDRALIAMNPWRGFDGASRIAQLYLNKSHALVALGRDDEALIAVDESLRLLPISVSAWVEKSHVLWKLKRYEEALTAADHAIALSATYPAAWEYRGYALARLGRLEEALRAYERATDLLPGSWHLWENIGHMHSRLHGYEDTLGAFVRAAQLNPAHSSIWINVGLALSRLDRHDEALRAYEKALELDPENAVALNNKAALLYLFGRSAEGLPYVEQALGKKSDHPAFHTTKGEILLALGHADLALAALERAISLDTDHLEAWKQKALALHALGYHEEAGAAERRAAELEE